MARLLVPLVLLLAVGAAAYLLLGGGGGPGDAGGVEREEFEDWTPPELRGLDRRPGRETRDDAPAAPNESESAADLEPGLRPRQIQGRIVDDATGEGIPEAYLALFPSDGKPPRPKLSPDSWLTSGLAKPDPFHTGRSAEDGRFKLTWKPGPGDRRFTGLTETVSVFARAQGWVDAMVGPHDHGADVEIRLTKGLSVPCRILDAKGRPIEKAIVSAFPGPETPARLGHGTWNVRPETDKDGRVTLHGFLPGDVMIRVDHPHYMPLESGPYDPEDELDLTLRLEPALRAQLVLHTDDGRVPTHPSLVWVSDPPQEETQAVLLRMRDDEERLRLGQGIRCEPIRLPASAKTLTLRVKADEYAIATVPTFRPPSDGGEETFEVTLTGDLGTGSIRIQFEDDQAQPLSALAADVKTRLLTLDPNAKPGGAFVVEPGVDLKITSLPAGSYRVLLFSKRFAPLETDVAVTAGQEAVRKLRANPPAKVRVRFLADQAMLVRFRVLQEGQEAVVFPETGGTTTDPDTGQPVLAAGEEGLVLSGLAAGTYTVVVVSEELTAPETIVHLREGDTTEVEIRVSRR